MPPKKKLPKKTKKDWRKNVDVRILHTSQQFLHLMWPQISKEEAMLDEARGSYHLWSSDKCAGAS